MRRFLIFISKTASTACLAPEALLSLPFWPSRQPPSRINTLLNASPILLRSSLDGAQRGSCHLNHIVDVLAYNFQLDGNR